MIKSDNLVEATILALQGKLPLTETKKLSTSKKIKKENVDVIVNKEDNSTYVETPDTIVTVADKDTIEDTIEDTSTNVSTQTPDVLEVPVDSDETIVPEQDLPDDTVQDIVDDETDIDSDISDEDLNENKKITELKKTTTNSDWKNYDMKILNYLVKKGGSATLSEIATEAGLPADDGQYVTFETLGKHIDGMADSRVAVSGSESDAGNQEVSLILDDGANDDVKGIQELKNKMDDQATDLEENKKLTEATQVEDFDDAQASLEAVADYIDNYTQFGFNGDPYGDFKDAYVELAETIRNCAQELHNIYYEGTYNGEHLRDQDDEDLQEAKKLRRSVRENKGKFDSKTFNEVFTKYFTQKYPNLKESKVTKLGVSKNGLKIEGVLINKDNKQKAICLEMKKVNNSNIFSKYQVVESKGILRESKDKSKTLNLMIHNKNNVLECKYLIQK